MAKRRGHNEGTIYQREDGRWRAQITLPDGRRLSHQTATRRDAQTWLTAKLKAQQDGADIAPARLTVGEFLDRWLADIIKPMRRPATYSSYESVVRIHIKPAIGELRLTNLRGDHIQRLCTDALEQGLSPRSAQYVHSVLHRALRYAVKWQLIPRNVADLADPPHPRQRPMTILTPDQARQFLASVRTDRLYALYVLAITTGMRRGELLGLSWANVDIANGQISVTGSLGRDRVVAETKSASSRRALLLSPLAASALREHRVRQLQERLLVGPRWHDSGLVFVTGIGTPLGGSNVLRAYKIALARAGLPAIRFHDLRHTAATLLLSEGVHPKIVAEMLGHSKISLTLDTYSHVLPSMQQEAAQRMQALLG